MRKWVPFRGKAPRFTDAAEAFFEVKLRSGRVVPDCIWSNEASKFDVFTFVSSTGPVIPIHHDFITHYRRE